MGTESPKDGRKGHGNGERMTEDKVDFFIRCACDNLIVRQDKQDPTVFRFKEKEFYLEVVDPRRMSTRCRRCSRTVIIPTRETAENFDVVRELRRTARDIEERRKGHQSPKLSEGSKNPKQEGGETK